MEIPGISAADANFGSTTPSQELDKNAFLQLLVTQLENQDPLQPIQNEDFIAQLATFSSLEELENLNDGISAMILLNQSNALLGQLTQSSALIGKDVSWLDPETGETRTGVVTSVSVADGQAQLRIGEEDVALANVTEIREPEIDGDQDDETNEG